jgi:hypothetical protein
VADGDTADGDTADGDTADGDTADGNFGFVTDRDDPWGARTGCCASSVGSGHWSSSATSCATAPHRFVELKAEIDSVSDRVLLETRDEMVSRGLVRREGISKKPARVEYSLTHPGESLTHRRKRARGVARALPRTRHRRDGIGRRCRERVWTRDGRGDRHWRRLADDLRVALGRAVRTIRMRL